MKNLYIIGARGFGREVYDLAICTDSYKNGDFQIIGYLDDKVDALEGYTGYPKIVDTVENHIPIESNIYVCALGTPETKKKYVDIINSKGGVFINLIHPNAELRNKINDQKGLIIFSNTFISVDVKIGNFITMQQFSFIGHDAQIGDWCHINTFCSINGFVKISDSVQLYTHSTILPKFTIGQNATVGAGSLVMKNVSENSTVFGNPAREIKTA